MNYTIEAKNKFQILGVCRSFHAPEAMKEIPSFWDEYFRNGCAEFACGQFAYCFDEKTDGTFRYAIGNHCTVGNDGVLHIFNRPDRAAVPDGFELLTVPGRTWLRVECVGPLPQSIQGMYPVIRNEWPAGWERIPGGEIEEYGYCASPEDSQKPDYKCFIWIPVRKKTTVISLREHPEQRERFIQYFSGKWGKPDLYRNCMTAAIASSAALPQWYLAVTDEDEIAGCAGLITNDFVSRMDLSPWLCALYVEEKFRHQGIGGKLIQTVADRASQTGYQNIYCCTDHTSYYERYGFEYIGTGIHPWDETSRIYRKELNGKMNIRDQFNLLAAEYDPNRRKFIPCFDDYYGESTITAVKLAGHPRRVLDLGAGTGLLTAYWLKLCPDAEYVLTDIADEMLKAARRRFQGLPNVSCLVSDYIRELPAGPFDVVMSALSLHHLTDTQKEEVFRRLHDFLPPGGWFFNYDQFCSADETLNQIQDDIWGGKILSSGMSDIDIARWQERRKLDKVCPVDAEVAMLRRSGFSMAECFFLSGKFAVIAARKGLE